MSELMNLFLEGVNCKALTLDEYGQFKVSQSWKPRTVD